MRERIERTAGPVGYLQASPRQGTFSILIALDKLLEKEGKYWEDWQKTLQFSQITRGMAKNLSYCNWSICIVFYNCGHV